MNSSKRPRSTPYRDGDYRLTTTCGPRKFSPTRVQAYSRSQWKKSDTDYPDYGPQYSESQSTYTNNDDDKYQWSSGYGRPDVPSSDDDQGGGEEQSSRVPRSPIKKLCRQRVEDDAPRRNFGDYDPVRPRNLNNRYQFRGLKSHLPVKLEQRRIIYKGISEEEIENRHRKQRIFGSKWRDQLDEKYNLKLAESPTCNELDQYSSFHDSGNSHITTNDRTRSEYGNNKNPHSRSLAIVHEEIETSNEYEDEDFDEEDPSNLSQHVAAEKVFIQQNSFTGYTTGRTEEKQFEDRSKMLGKTWYEFDTKQSTDKGREAFLGSQKGFPEWKPPLKESQSNFGLNSASANESEPMGRDYGIASSPTPDVRPATAAWMNYSKGVGLYDGHKNAQSSNHASSNANFERPGLLSAGREEDADERCFDENQYECIPNIEREFCLKLAEIEYNFKLIRRPALEKDGAKYIGYQLQMWPNAHPTNVQVVYGLRMTDPTKAKDSVLAEALNKLSNVHYDYKADLLKLKEFLMPRKKPFSVSAYAGYEVNSKMLLQAPVSVDQSRPSNVGMSREVDNNFRQDAANPQPIAAPAFATRSSSHVFHEVKVGDNLRTIANSLPVAASASVAPSRTSYNVSREAKVDGNFRKVANPPPFAAPAFVTQPRSSGSMSREANDKFRQNTNERYNFEKKQTSVYTANAANPKVQTLDSETSISNSRNVNRTEKVGDEFRLCIKRLPSLIDEHMQKEWGENGPGQYICGAKRRYDRLGVGYRN